MMRGVMATVALSVSTLVGCVDTDVVPLSAEPPFAVRLRDTPPTRGLTPSSGVAKVSFGRGSSVLLQGWVGSKDSGLIIVTDRPAEVLWVHRLVQPDPAVTPPAPADDLGFRMLVRAVDEPIERVCVLEDDGGSLSLLTGSTYSWCSE